MADERIGILGSGDVGKTLAHGFDERGWDVKLGTSRQGTLREWAAETTRDVSVGPFEAAADHGDVVVLAVKGEATMDVLELAGHDNFVDALVLDATNPLDLSGGMPPDLLFGGTDSLGEHVQAALPDSYVVKCFNTVSHTQMVDPDFEQGTPKMLLCGNDEGAKDRTAGILRSFGWPGAMDCGDIVAARYLEALVPLWVRVGGVLDTYGHAFAVVE